MHVIKQILFIYTYACYEHRLLSITENLPIITTHPNDTTVLLHYGNESAMFSCDANNGSSDIQYSWFSKTDDDDIMKLRATSSELVLTPVTVEMNNTQYYCAATNDRGNVISECAHLTVTSKLIMYL